MMQLKDECREDFLKRLEKSCLLPAYKPYIRQLEQSNYWLFDRLAMLMLNYGEIAFTYGVSILVASDPKAPEIQREHDIID